MTEIVYSNNLTLNNFINNLEKQYSNIFYISEPNVWNIYKDSFNVQNIYLLPSGDNSKSLIEYSKLINFLLDKKVKRNDLIICVGGGALSDTAGFAAATVLRGIDWAIIPTTLLSMVDASIGGKVAININNLKNLVGAFHLPKYIFIDKKFLNSLPKIEFDNGMGEIIKYSFLSTNVNIAIKESSEIQKIIKECVKYKSEIIKIDLNEKKERKYLNLGHSIGHAIESYYKISHGTSIYFGCLIILIIFELEELKEEFNLLSKKLNINYQSPWNNSGINIPEIIKILSFDKKSLKNNIVTIVIPKEIAKIYLIDYSLNQIQERLLSKKEIIDKL